MTNILDDYGYDITKYNAIAFELKRDVNYINLSQTNSIRLLKAFNDNIKPAELQELILDVLLEKKTVDDLKTKFCRSK